MAERSPLLVGPEIDSEPAGSFHLPPRWTRLSTLAELALGGLTGHRNQLGGAGEGSL